MSNPNTNTLTAARSHALDVFTQSLQESDSFGPCEADTDLNDAQRQLIRAMHDTTGAAFLGWVNVPTAHRAGPFVWQWKPGTMVYNFGASFVVPTMNAELIRLIKDRIKATYTTAAADYARISAIFDRVQQVGGYPLTWS